MTSARIDTQTYRCAHTHRDVYMHLGSDFYYSEIMSFLLF